MSGSEGIFYTDGAAVTITDWSVTITPDLGAAVGPALPAPTPIKGTLTFLSDGFLTPIACKPKCWSCGDEVDTKTGDRLMPTFGWLCNGCSCARELG